MFIGLMDHEEIVDVAGKQPPGNSGKLLVMTLKSIATYTVQGRPVATSGVARAGSLPWDIEDEFAGSSSAVRGIMGACGEDSEDGPPPLSQGEALGAIVSDSATSGKGVQHEGGTGGKTTPSTLSDDADDAGAVGPDAEKRPRIGGFGAKKRMNSKDGDPDGQETQDEGHDAKRKPRKSARLA